jgi:hypothetical protein
MQFGSLSGSMRKSIDTSLVSRGGKQENLPIGSSPSLLVVSPSTIQHVLLIMSTDPSFRS